MKITLLVALFICASCTASAQDKLNLSVSELEKYKTAYEYIVDNFVPANDYKEAQTLSVCLSKKVSADLSYALEKEVYKYKNPGSKEPPPDMISSGDPPVMLLAEKMNNVGKCGDDANALLTFSRIKQGEFTAKLSYYYVIVNEETFDSQVGPFEKNYYFIFDGDEMIKVLESK